jgi:putative ABC transport system permease protein
VDASRAALLLAVMGTYGVVAQTVRQRTHEIGVRIAIGARSTDVLRMIVADGVKVSAAGVAAGLAGALVLTRLLADMLFDVSPADPLTFAAVAGALLATAGAAAWVPARRATRISPVVALHGD